MKPPLGARINPSHPFSQSLLLAVLFNEGFGPALITSGSSVLPVQVASATGSPAWKSNLHGIGLNFPTVNDYITITDGTFSFLPSKNVTIAVIRLKIDSTNRGVGFFGTTATTASRCGAHCPYNDGIVYWDFGGTSSPNRLTVSGLSFSTTIPEKWIFTAGDKGSSIWQNGVKVASQSTGISRTVANDNLTLNVGNGVNGSDIQDINYFAIYSTQWSDALCAYWSASPYEHLYSPMMKSYFFLSPSPTGFVPAVNTQTWPPGDITLPIHQFERI